ncbi:acetyl/propionyl/methylcrotonyl-CoA carboxylase subunit alpha [Piscinibacter sakaiensis]|uniref:acetyl/propionyl/methylcrotonyl-CoA carboxylase subunit alpha n=1 Tax=Piscinibacter sakaiensis TaxID=1547922 RepID=UPI003AAB36E4
MFKKILIANRGEIACRIARTCRRLGVAVAGVHSSADRDALHVHEIGESVEIGGAPASESYLRIDAVIAAAKAVHAQAIHPGFGFLAENAAFARAVEAAGLVFIGPTADLIGRLGDKAAAKREALAAQVPIVPGSMSPSTDPAEIAASVREIGLPVMLKAAAGGGGKGMRGITSFDSLSEDIESAMREAKNSFGDAGLIVEKLISQGRHIEIQIAGDGQGHVIHLFERECTLQRRHQKVIEEAPAAMLSAKLRDRMTADAVRLGERLMYRGVGTVEFIVGADDYHFLEVNPRLQVEHPVTEMVTGLDIVEIMLRIASGEGLALRQEDVRCSGHAVEARVCAEDPAAGFLPSTGRLAHVQFPGHGVRVETGIRSGMEITPYYDPMLAKLITSAPTRNEALDQLKSALDATIVFGVTTNIQFLRHLIDLPQTRSGSFHTRLIDEEIAGWAVGESRHDTQTLAIAACCWLQSQRSPAGLGPWSSWARSGWQMRSCDDGLAPIPSLHVEAADGSAEIRFAPLHRDGSMLVGVNDERLQIALTVADDGRFLAVAGSRRETVHLHCDGEMVYVHDRRGSHVLRAVPYLSYISTAAQSSGDLKAPMMGLILKVNVVPGDRVTKGTVVAILESMKMEMRIVAESDGIVAAVHCQPGLTVERAAVVAVVTPD